MHDGCFLFSFSFKAYNFSAEIDIKTMNSILVIFGKHRRIIKIYKPRQFQLILVHKISEIIHFHLQPFCLYFMIRASKRSDFWIIEAFIYYKYTCNISTKSGLQFLGKLLMKVVVIYIIFCCNLIVMPSSKFLKLNIH